jgi:hypothetical protein
MDDIFDDDEFEIETEEDLSITEDTKTILEKFPFLTYGKYGGRHYLGIVQNFDSMLVSMYLYERIVEESDRKIFLRCGEEWWWGSNRQIPINILLKEKFRRFKGCLMHFAQKDFEIITGPTVSLQDTITRRVKRRQIVLIRSLPEN